MDEHKGFFRTVTTNHSPQFGREVNALYILDGMLNIVGRIEDIAPGEVIYSARFMGDRIFMVTFDVVDPLFAIDASDPFNPVIKGELKIPGFSSYLHPFGENHLLGFGYDTYEQRGIAFNLGMKLSLFDVTDMTDPRELFTDIIGVRGTSAEVLSNHKALFFDAERGLLIFSAAVLEHLGLGVSSPLTHGTLDFMGAYVYDVSIGRGFELRTRITHYEEQRINPHSLQGIQIRRAVRIGETVYLISDARITAHKLSTFDVIGELRF
jgi:uncharacterized secreted protein with C-terminal beta-propeller domain